jgi:hypothetical protein
VSYSAVLPVAIAAPPAAVGAVEAIAYTGVSLGVLVVAMLGASLLVVGSILIRASVVRPQHALGSPAELAPWRPGDD